MSSDEVNKASDCILRFIGGKTLENFLTDDLLHSANGSFHFGTG